MKVTAIILTRDAERHVTECIKSVQWADEILVVDSESEDRTVTMAQELGARVVVNPWPGFTVQRNLALELATHEWVLMIDVDERVTPELAQEIVIALETAEKDQLAGFSTPVKNYFWNKWMRCWYPDRSHKLFRKSKAHFIDRAVHESVSIDGKTRPLNNPRIHYSYENLAHFVNKMNWYSSLGAQEKIKKGQKFNFVKLLLHPTGAFLKMYFLQGGFRDGIPGFVLAVSYSFYAFMKYAKMHPQDRVE